MATTPNFNWATPDNTGLVKNGALDIRTLGNAIDASMADLKGGTTGQVLKKATNTDMDFVWSADSAGMTNPMTTTGDTIYSSSGSTPARLGIGSTGQVLTVAGGVPTWATPSAGGATGPAFSAAKTSGDQTYSTATWTKVTFNTELFDTANCFASSRFTPNKAGYYQINACNTTYSATSNAGFIAAIYKNGTAASGTGGSLINNNYGGAASSVLIYLNGSTDYIEAYAYCTGSSASLIAGTEYQLLNGVWIRD